jgi:hypothetical protein
MPDGKHILEIHRSFDGSGRPATNENAGLHGTNKVPQSVTCCFSFSDASPHCPISLGGFLLGLPVEGVNQVQKYGPLATFRSFPSGRFSSTALHSGENDVFAASAIGPPFRVRWWTLRRSSPPPFFSRNAPPTLPYRRSMTVDSSVLRLLNYPLPTRRPSYRWHERGSGPSQERTSRESTIRHWLF